jgi:hypothetical protein
MGIFDIFGDVETDPASNPKVRAEQQNTANAVAKGEAAADAGQTSVD